MARTDKKTAKAHRAFNAHQPAPLRTPRAAPVLIAQSRLRSRYTAIKNEHKARMKRLCTALLGTNLHFRGHISISTAEKAAQPDAARLGDIQRELDDDTAAVFWTDGSEWNGVLGGAVAWHAASGVQAVYYKLGRSTRGSASDAELFASAAAVARGRQRVQEGGEVRLVRVYSDAQTLLESLRDGEQMVFGPLDESYFPLRALYEDTDWLVAKGVGVELVWVKGHRGSEGNKIADAAASRAVQEQYTADDSAGRGDERDLEVPGFWKQLGPDWAAEWLYRQRFHELREAFTPKNRRVVADPQLLECLKALESLPRDPSVGYEYDAEGDMDGLIYSADNVDSYDASTQYGDAAAGLEMTSQGQDIQNAPFDGYNMSYTSLGQDTGDSNDYDGRSIPATKASASGTQPSIHGAQAIAATNLDGGDGSGADRPSDLVETQPRQRTAADVQADILKLLADIGVNFAPGQDPSGR